MVGLDGEKGVRDPGTDVYGGGLVRGGDGVGEWERDENDGE